MTTFRVVVTAEDIEPVATDVRREWARPVESALARLTGESVDIDGGGDYGNVATIGQGAWTLVVDLPENASEWLDHRWATGEPGESFAFDLVIPGWISNLAHGLRGDGGPA